MNILSVKNSSVISASNTAANANTAFTFGVRFFAYSVFYHFYFYFKGSKSQRLQRASA